MDKSCLLYTSYFSGILNGFKEKAEELGYDITFINNEHVNHKMSYLSLIHI